MTNGKEKELPSFWVPSQTPAAKFNKSEKPDPTILCPVSQKPMKAKDLIDVKFTCKSLLQFTMKCSASKFKINIFL